jgi:8-oxo-dGTP pyrophosphatase MutT (NUDIX family)
VSNFWTKLASSSGYRYRIPKAGLGNVLLGPRGGSPTAKGKNPVATTNISYVTPGTPMMPEWDGEWAMRSLYHMSGYVMRCARTVADTISGLPFRAGPDPTMPVNANPASPLAKLLGPSTLTAPGGPNPTTSARALWAWSIVQYIVTGRMAWELIRDTDDMPRPRGRDRRLDQAHGTIFELWPLVSGSLFPVASTPTGDGKPTTSRPGGLGPGSSGRRWWDSFNYSTPLGDIELGYDRVFYAWRPGGLDWREPESDLQAARVAVQLVIGIERYMWGLMKNQMVASKLVITPFMEEAENRRAWQESFLSEFTGYDQAGKTIFAEVENEYDESGKMIDKANIEVVDLSTRGIDAQMREVSLDAKNDINIAMGVPRSLIGDAAQRIYANSNAEYRNFWVLKVIPFLSEMQDPVNTDLAPQVGDDMGWFDLSNVAAVQPPQVFAPPDIGEAIELGVVRPEDVARILNITAAEKTAQDVATIPLGEEATQSGAVGGRALERITDGRIRRPEMLNPRDGWRAVHDGLRLAPNWFVRYRGMNTWTYHNGVWAIHRQTERAVMGYAHSYPMPDRAREMHERVACIRRSREQGSRARAGKLIAAGLAVKAANTGRVLMLQRSDNDPTDPHGGKWEFPGGHIEQGEDSLDAAIREWCEETGCKPPAGDHVGSWTSKNGVYRGHVMVVPTEDDVQINTDPSRRKVLNPDDPDHDDIEVAAWWHPKHVTEDNPAIRREIQQSRDLWHPVVRAGKPHQRGERSIVNEPLTHGLNPTALAELDALGDRLAEVL